MMIAIPEAILSQSVSTFWRKGRSLRVDGAPPLQPPPR